MLMLRNTYDDTIGISDALLSVVPQTPSFRTAEASDARQNHLELEVCSRGLLASFSS